MSPEDKAEEQEQFNKEFAEVTRDAPQRMQEIEEELGER